MESFDKLSDNLANALQNVSLLTDSEEENTVKDSENQNDFIFELMNYFVENKLCLASLERMLKVLNKEPSIRNHYPENKKSILKLFMDQAPDQVISAKAVIMCDSCEEHNEVNIHELKSNCSRCNVELRFRENNFFVLFDLTKQLFNNVNENFDNFNFARNSVKGEISDFNDGKFYSKLHSKPNLAIKSNRLYLHLTMNTDGAQLFNSSKTSLWPVLFVQNDLDPQIRYNSKNLILAGIYCGQTKPDFDIYLFPIIRTLNDLQKRPMLIEKRKIIYEVIPLTISCIADLPAKAELLKMNNHNGQFACIFCKHPGKSVKNTDNTAKRKNIGIRYPELEKESTKRNHSTAVQEMLKAENSNQIVCGFKGKNIYNISYCIFLLI